MTTSIPLARQLIRAHGYNAMSYQILNPGIRHWLSADGQAMAGYVDAIGYRVVAGAPLCAAERIADVTRELELDAQHRHRRVCYFGVHDRFVTMMARRQQRSFAVILLGAQPAWEPKDWPRRVAAKSSIRQQLNRARNKGVTVSLWPAPRGADPALTQCLNDWLATRRMPAMSFLVEPRTLGMLEDRRLFVAEQGPRVVGFLVASPIPRRKGWLIEQIIRGRDAPNGTTELLLDGAMTSLAQEGAEFVTLGLSPLSSRAGVSAPPQPWWLRTLLAWGRLHGRRFYDFDGLDAFKAKLLPGWWEPLYAVGPQPQVSLSMLAALVAVFAGRSPFEFALRGLGWVSLRREPGVS